MFKPKILLVGGAPNVGDAAIGEAIITGFQKMWPGSEVRILANDAEHYLYLSLRENVSVVRPQSFWQIPRKVCFVPERFLVHFCYWGTLLCLMLFRGHRFVPGCLRNILEEHLAWADMVVFQGGPRWTHLSPGKERGLRLFVLAAKRNGLPLFAIGQSIGPFEETGIRSWYARRLAAATLKQMDIISVRDAWSLGSLESLAIKGPQVAISTDAAVTLRAVEDVTEETELPVLVSRRLARERLIAVAVRAFQPVYGIDSAALARFCDQFSALCDAICERLGWIVFLSTDYRKHVDRENDLEVFDRILFSMKRRDRVIVIDRTLEPGVLKFYYSQCDALISVRLHPIILAATSGVPCLSLAYDRKCRDFMSQLHMERFCLNIKTFTTSEALALLQELIDNGQLYRMHLHRTTEQLRSSAEQVYDRVRQAVCKADR